MIDLKAFVSALKGSYIFRRQTAPEVMRAEKSLTKIEERIIAGRKVPLDKKLEVARRRLRIEVSILLHDSGLTSIGITEEVAPLSFSLMTGGFLDGPV